MLFKIKTNKKKTFSITKFAVLQVNPDLKWVFSESIIIRFFYRKKQLKYMNKYLFLVFKNMDTVMTCNTNIFSTILSNLAINNRLQNPKKKFNKVS